MLAHQTKICDHHVSPIEEVVLTVFMLDALATSASTTPYYCMYSYTVATRARKPLVGPMLTRVTSIKSLQCPRRALNVITGMAARAGGEAE